MAETQLEEPLELQKDQEIQSHKRGRLLYCKHASFPGTQPHACSKKYTRRREGGGGEGGGKGGKPFISYMM